MKRIDEDTYIDDTLVTCAEYQLFIDEMWKQGRHRQPDHWNSHRFPVGQAREPILGVRHSDALAFCEWLTQHEDGKWQYRLPTQIEAIEYPIKPTVQLSLGYWIISHNNSNFIWNDKIPIEARKLSAPFDTYWMMPIMDKIYNSIIEKIDNPDIKPKNDHKFDFVRDRKFELARDRASTRPLDLDAVVRPSLDLAPELEDYFTRDFRHIIARSIPLDFELKLAFERVQEYITVIARGPNGDVYIDRALDLWFDIFTLTERMEGRFPPFEGIRLVKERIK